MANSLMELYGGGMVGKSNNYQLGGQIARSRRGREFQAELADLQRKKDRDAEKMGKANLLGNLFSKAGELAGSFIPIPGVGRFVGKSIGKGLGSGLGRFFGEKVSGYTPTEFEGGKYALQTKEDLQGASDDFSKSSKERAFIQGLDTGWDDFITRGGLDYLDAKFGDAGSLPDAGTPEEILDVDEPFQFPSSDNIRQDFRRRNAMSSNVLSSDTPARAFQDMNTVSPQASVSSFMPTYDYSPTSYESLINYGTRTQGPLQSGSRYPGLIMNKQGGMIPKYPHGGPVHTNMSAEALANMSTEEARKAAQQTSTVTDYAGTAKSPMSTQTPKTMGGIDTEALSQLSASGFNMGDFLGGSVLGDGSGVDLGVGTDMGFTPGTGTSAVTGTGTGTGTGMGTGTGTGTGGSAPGAYGGYGTAIDPMAALGQMGMDYVANDPRLEKYLKDLPQFGMGYQQKFGDIQSGGRQALLQMYNAQRNMGGGFAGAGAGAQAFGQGYSGLMGEQARQRRGVVEGFQSDLLSSIRDIEEKGQFTFGQGEGGTTQQDAEIQALVDQGYTQEEAERQIFQDMQGGSGGTRS